MSGGSFRAQRLLERGPMEERAPMNDAEPRSPERSFLRSFAPGFLILLTALLFSPPLPAAAPTEEETAPTYPIRLEREARAGARFDLTSEARIFRSEGVVEGEEAVQSEGSGEGKVRLEARATVEAVNSEGGITRARYEVKSFEGSIDGTAVEAIPAGSVLTTHTDGQQTRIRLEGGELGPQQLLLLIQVLETAREGEPGDDDLFGTEEPQAVGAAWPLHPAAVVAAFSANGTELTVDAVSGGSRLVAQRPVAGVECLQIEGRLDVVQMIPPGVDETAFVNARLSLEYSGDYPLDDTRLAMDGRILSRLEIRHILFEPEEEGDLPVYHLRVNESDKKFSIRPLEAAEEPEGEASSPAGSEEAARSHP